MARQTKRDQILQAARRCFYEYGITATGVDTIAAAAQVSKRTLYNHFPSKDELLFAYIRWRDEQWRERLASRLSGVDDPQARILVYFDAYFDTPDDEDFRGCGFLNAAAEISGDDSPVLAAIAAHKDRVRLDIEGLLRDLDHPSPSATGAAIAALLEGACALGGVHRSRMDLQPLKDATVVLMGQGVTQPTA